MANDNCLEGIKCPECGHEDRFFISVEVLCEVTDDGAVPSEHSDMEWQDTSFIRCCECNKCGRVGEFTEKPTT